MKFNPSTLLLTLAAMAVMHSCKKEEEDSNVKNEEYRVEYKNQVLQGKIGGEDWTFVLGETHSGEGGYQTDYFHSFTMADTAQNDTCFITTNDRSKIIFSLDDDNRLLTPGKYPLSFDFNSFTGRTVTLVDYIPGSVNNIICSEGEYEILTVDTLKKVVTGRMDAYYDKQNFVNGNFTIKYCYWK